MRVGKSTDKKHNNSQNGFDRNIQNCFGVVDKLDDEKRITFRD